MNPTTMEADHIHTVFWLSRGVQDVKRRKKKRGFSDKLYIVNIVAVHMIVTACLCLTALSGKLGIQDVSPLSAIPEYAYKELALHTGFIIWKAKTENCRKNKDVNGLQVLENEEL